MLLGQSRTKALSRDWVVVELEVSKHDESEFRRDISTRLRSTLLELSPKVRWTDRFHHAAAVLKSFTISVDAVGTWTAGRRQGASFTAEALAEAVTITGGYPYFVQELGYAVWTVADGPLITKADVEARHPRLRGQARRFLLPGPPRPCH